MVTNICSRRWLALSLTLVLLAPAAQLVLPTARAQEPVGQLTVTGKVKVNGHPAATGDIVSSGSTVETAKGSSAVVSLGKLGRVEVLPDSSLKLKFDEGSIKGTLEAGRVRLSTSSGVTATVSTRNGKVVADSSQANTFTVDLACGNTIVSTQSGKVELRAGTTVKQIAAGGQDTAGTARPGCTRGQ